MSRIDTVGLRNTLLLFIGSGLLLSLGACGGGGGGESIAPPVATADTVPDSFGFGERLAVPSDSVIESDSITVTGIDAPAAISVTGGEYSIGGGAYTSGTGTVTNGQAVRVRHTSSGDPATTVTTVLTIGGVNGTFSSTTASRVAAPDEFLSSSVVLGRPTDSSISISVLVAEAIEAYVEYRTASAGYEPAPDPMVPRTIQANEPYVFELEGLVADTRYFYRLKYRDTSNPDFVTSSEGRFHTHRPPGSSFGFAVHADPHLGSKRRSGPDPAERASEEIYAVTQAVTVASAADFVIDLGDTFMTGQNHGFGLYASQNGIPRADMEESEVIGDYTFMRSLFSQAAHSTPLYLAPGNHEAETHRLHDGTAFNPAVWSNNARKRYFPTPTDGDFYSGSETIEMFVDRHDGYYAWEWGDALFVVLDPFWYEGFGNDQWARTLGFEQYSWLKATLESSTTTFKFVFLHHLVGGNDNEFGRARGGALFAEYYEWGGKSEGTEAFDFPTRRPGWGGIPIHDLLAANGVQIVFTGHDHTYIKELHPDGIIYQTVPQPSHANTNQNQADRNALNYGYDVDNPSTVVLPSSGLLYVEVSPTVAMVEYRKIVDGCAVVTPGDCYQSADVYSVPAAP